MPNNKRIAGKGRSDTIAPKRIKIAARAANVGSGRTRSLRQELERAADGLYHTSESDFPFRFFTLPAEGEEDLTPEGFLIRLGLSQYAIDTLKLPVNKLIEERPLEGFFPTADDLAASAGTAAGEPEVVSESKRFQKLEALLKKRLRGVKVLRVGMVDIRCYIAGLYGKDDIAGLVTTSIET